MQETCQNGFHAKNSKPIALLPEDVRSFVSALFSDDDYILVRPIESWVPVGKKERPSRVLFKHVRCLPARRIKTDWANDWWNELQEAMAKENGNIFFGVCPRVEQGFDLAWQIRTVRAIYQDLDHCSLDQAQERIAKAQLPEPSIIVNSGHGVHLYWLLAEPYLIDDNPENFPIRKEWVEDPITKSKRPREYILRKKGEKDYKTDLPLSPKAHHIQDVMAGIASLIGGDATHDLARILRLPHTLNRKNARNGAEPVPCELIEYRPDRRYPLSDFEKFAAASPSASRREKAEKVILPTGKTLTLGRQGKLEKLINASHASGDRSKADWKLCCWALREGIDRETIWEKVKEVGKFAESGRSYFDLTWGNAEDEIRLEFLKEAEAEDGEETSTGEGPKTTLVTNFFSMGEEERTGLSPWNIKEQIELACPGWPKRIGNLLFLENAEHKPVWLESTAQTFSWLQGLSPGFENTVKWARGETLISEAQFDAFLRQQTTPYDSIELFPHYPLRERCYYMHPEPTGGNGEHLASFLSRFNPASDIDSDLLKACVLSPFSGVPPGSTPAFLFKGQDEDRDRGRGIGKSTVPKMVGRLRNGYIDLLANQPMDKAITRLLSSSALECGIVLLDNIKSLKFSWAELEGLITSDIISGHRLYLGEGRRPNTLTYFLTLNGAYLSKDMAQRCVIIELSRPRYSATWEEDMVAYVEANRWAIIGDILAELKSETEQLAKFSRWGAWEQAVLSKVAEPADCQKVILERQAAADEDAAETEMVRSIFIAKLVHYGKDPKNAYLFIPTKMAADWVNEVMNEKKATPKVSAYLGTLTIQELKRGYDDKGNRGWTWIGENASPHSKREPVCSY